MRKYARKLAVMLALSFVATSVPYHAQAASTPAYKTERASLYENATTNGVYTYTVKNLKKGQKVKWVLTGKGKKYATLKYTQTTAKSTTSSNKITIKTNKDTEAANAVIALTAKVYNANGTLVTSIKDRAKIKVQATDIAITTSKITDDLTSLMVGHSYDFDTTIAPTNTTSKVYWTVTNVSGEDHSKEITTDGVWTPTANGKYTVKAMAKNSKSGKTLVYHTASVSVGLSLTSVKQTASNQFYAVFNEDASQTVKTSDLSIAATNGSASLSASDIKFTENGKAAYITTGTNFKDKTSYTITYGSNARAFIASVGEVKKAVILTETAEAGKETPIEYALYDSNNIDVKSAASGTTTLSAEVINGYKTEDDSLFMYTVGKTAEVTLTYKKDTSSTAIKVTKTIKCIEATSTEADKTDFTLTDSKQAPDFDAANYTAVTSTALGETTYAHFRAQDGNKNVIKYDSVQYISADDNSLIIDNDGKLTPIKTGTVKVSVVAKEGQSEVTYSFNVVIQAKKTATTAVLSNKAVTMSNVYDSNYKEYIDVTFQDQYGSAIKSKNASCTIKETTGRQVLATYDKENQQIVLTARSVTVGTYNYSATFTVDGATLVSYFSVTVMSVPATGSVGYQLAIDHPTQDLVVDANTTGNKTVNVRLKKYVGGVFAGFTSITSATITKDDLYYTNDLTIAGTKAIQSAMILNGNSVSMTPVTMSYTNSNVGECKKAATGTYTITVNYYDTSHTLNMESVKLTLVDTQDSPAVTIKSTTSSKTVANALALVNDCISLSDDSVIYSCTATGSTAIGDAITVNAGQKIHIDTISIKQIVNIGTNNAQKVYVYYTINVDTTLQNKS